MSMETWEIRGYGIEFGDDDGMNTTPDRIRALLEFAPDFKSEIQNLLKRVDVDFDSATVDDFVNCQDKYYNTGIPFIISKVMNERYDAINFMTTDCDENSRLFLFMPACMPWEMTEFEKNITEEQLKTMIKEHYSILYDDEPFIGRVSIHNFG